MYFHTGYQLLYGQFHTRRQLEPFYTRHGFTVLDASQYLDLSVNFSHCQRHLLAGEQGF
jgi:hypothetical protein